MGPLSQWQPPSPGRSRPGGSGETGGTGLGRRRRRRGRSSPGTPPPAVPRRSRPDRRERSARRAPALPRRRGALGACRSPGRERRGRAGLPPPPGRCPRSVRAGARLRGRGTLCGALPFRGRRDPDSRPGFCSRLVPVCVTCCCLRVRPNGG